ncbi:MazG-like family protein [Streptomyces laurentii]|uniref:MazG-like family protein n=1 Tax=Streptomyces laurentii TaxID=39478 RepID=UPI00367C26EF
MSDPTDATDPSAASDMTEVTEVTSVTDATGVTGTPEAPPTPDTPTIPDALDPWDTVTRLHAWLTAHQTLPPGQEVLLRVLKLAEEVGETAQAVIGATGQNPRKGHSHTWQDVEAELSDVIITAMVALRTLTPAAPEVFATHLHRVAERSLPKQEPGAG